MSKKKQTATYQFQSFIGSKKYYEFDLLPDDLAILTVICRYLDMPKHVCCLKQVNLAKEARMSERMLRNRLKYLSEKKLLIRYKRGKLYYYELGENIANNDYFDW